MLLAHLTSLWYAHRVPLTPRRSMTIRTSQSGDIQILPSSSTQTCVPTAVWKASTLCPQA
eukprot:1967790-Amphidinium_carterae.1